jgi:2-(3-amino-3-carboxypropyl)histidine synthase
MRKLKDIQKTYDLELERVLDSIKQSKSKRVLIQFADGLKPYATEVADYLEEKTGVEILIWLGSCYGACDIPVGLEGLNIDLIIQFGHNSMMPTY